MTASIMTHKFSLQYTQHYRHVHDMDGEQGNTAGMWLLTGMQLLHDAKCWLA
jgi:hypothetical protein